MKLIFLGPPGAGKGTQAGAVANALEIKHISTGDMFREAIRNRTRTGLMANEYIVKGLLVPDEVVVQMVQERLGYDDCANGYLLDGFPRPVFQAMALDEISAPDKVIDLEVPDRALVIRLAGRRICKDCAGTFNISRLDDLKHCPICGGELIHRIDDHEETIVSRLEVYHKTTESLLKYYKEQGKLMVVNGDQAHEAVAKEILKSLGIA